MCVKLKDRVTLKLANYTSRNVTAESIRTQPDASGIQYHTSSTSSWPTQFIVLAI